MISETSLNESLGTVSSLPSLDEFEKLNESKELLPQTPYLLHFTLQNNSPASNPHTEWILKMPMQLTDIEGFAIYENGDSTYFQSGFFTKISKRTFCPTVKGNFIRFSIPLGEEVQVFMRVLSKRKFMNLDVEGHIQSSTLFYKNLNQKKQSNALFLGFVLLILFYNLTLYFFNKEKAYIHYSVYLGGIVLFVLYNGGEFSDLLGPPFFSERPNILYVGKVTFYIALFGYLLFIREFLDLKNSMPKWNTTLRYLGYWAFASMFIDGFLMWSSNFSYDFADKYSTLYVLLFLVVTITFLVPLYKKKEAKGKFIVLGMSLMGMGIFITIFSRLQTIDFSTAAFKVGAILEIVVFSLGLAYRQRELEKEKQNTIFKLQSEQTEALRLKEINDLRTKLYTNIAHEFRTPLTVISGLTEELLDEGKSKKTILRNTNQLTELINQLLDLSKLDAGKMELQVEREDIVSYVAFLTESFESIAKVKNIRISYFSDFEQLITVLDVQKLGKIINNLLSNALKFTPENGKIQVHLFFSKNKEHVKISVKDSGIGIAEKDQAHIFDRFYQPETSTKGETGTGIGLAMVKEFTELMGGSIKLKSTFGKGSEFTISLPCTVLDTLSEENDKEADEKEKQIILIAEDNPDIQFYLNSILNSQYELLCAYNGVEAVGLATEHIPDIILLDVMMPKQDGFETLEILKDDERTNHIPVIMLTALAEDQSKMKSLLQGADAFLSKPFEKEELLVRIKNLLRLQTAILNQPDNVAEQKLAKIRETFLEKVYSTIEKKLSHADFSIEDLAKAMKLSQAQVNRKIKALSGKTPVQLIRQYRLNRATEILEKGGKTISEVAFTVGFNDPSYFSKVYQKEFGVRPSEVEKAEEV